MPLPITSPSCHRCGSHARLWIFKLTQYRVRLLSFPPVSLGTKRPSELNCDEIALWNQAYVWVRNDALPASGPHDEKVIPGLIVQRKRVLVTTRATRNENEG